MEKRRVSSSSFSSQSQSPPLTFYDFLDRMRHPASLDLVRFIKSFIVSFTFKPANSETDSKRFQDFLLTMEAYIRNHPLWIGANEEDIDSAIEGLEKYVMTKLFTRTFASSQEDAVIDQEISEKVCLLQKFIKPEHLDIPGALQNEASWLLAEKELQKINAVKAPREKLLCILSCCRVINNLFLNVAMSEDRVPAGADDFLPVLIYITIKANPPQLHSNLKFIQLYRKQTKLISEAAYYFTNLSSTKSFILNLDAKSLSIDETEFQESMKAAKLANKERQIEHRPTDSTPFTSSSNRTDDERTYPFMEAEAAELTVGDVERLLHGYKEVVSKYSMLCREMKALSASNQATFEKGNPCTHEEDQSLPKQCVMQDGRNYNASE